jgi:hypothetical protein
MDWATRYCVETGEIATALRDDGSLVVVQVRDAHMVDHDGPELTVNGADQLLGPNDLSARPPTSSERPDHRVDDWPRRAVDESTRSVRSAGPWR